MAQRRYEAHALARRLGVQALVNEFVDLGRRVAYYRPGRKVMPLVSAMLLGPDSIDGCDVLRSGVPDVYSATA